MPQKKPNPSQPDPESETPNEPKKRRAPNRDRLTGPTSVQAINKFEHEKQALILRGQGKTFRQIANAIGITIQASHVCVVRALARANAEVMETAISYREEQWAYCQVMVDAAFPKAAEGDLDAIKTVLNIFARMARLRGLDVQPETGGTEGAPWAILAPDQQRDQWLARIEELKRLKEKAASNPSSATVEPVEAEFENVNGNGKSHEGNGKGNHDGNGHHEDDQDDQDDHNDNSELF